MEEETKYEKLCRWHGEAKVVGAINEILSRTEQSESEPPIPELTPEVRRDLLVLAAGHGFTTSLGERYKELVDLFLDYRNGSGGDAPEK